MTDYLRRRSLAENERIDIKRIELEPVDPAVERLVGGDRQQVVRVPADDLLSSPHVVLPVDRTLEIQHSK